VRITRGIVADRHAAGLANSDIDVKSFARGRFFMLSVVAKSE